MGLTAKQERFAQCIALEGMSYADAYKTAYDVGSDTAMSTVYENASHLASDTKIQPRIQELRSEYLARGQDWTLPRLLRESERNLAGAQEDRAWSAANGALAFIGKATGLVSDQTQPQGQVVNITKVTYLVQGAEPEILPESQRFPEIPESLTDEKDPDTHRLDTTFPSNCQ